MVPIRLVRAPHFNPILMKQHFAVLFLFTLVAALGAGCATLSPDQSKQQMVTAAGFQPITPTKPDQAALLPKLPAGKVSKVVYGGKTYYVLPDAANNRAFVGGVKQYNAYQEILDQQNLRDENREETEMNATQGGGEQISEVEWTSWSGWHTAREAM